MGLAELQAIALPGGGQLKFILAVPGRRYKSLADIERGFRVLKSEGAYSGERDRRFRHRDRDSDERDRGVVLRDLILWPSCVFGRFAFAGCQLN